MTRLTRPSRLKRSAAALAVAIVATAGLSGCSEQRLGAAAVVDGQRIATDDLQHAAQSYLKIVPDAKPGEVQRSVLQRIILSEVIDKAAGKEGVGVSAGRVAAERDDLLKSVGGRTGLIRALAAQQTPTVLAPEYLDRWFKDQLLFRRIATKLAGPGGDAQSAAVSQRTSNLLARTARSMDIQVNPRYGKWSTTDGVTPLISGGLSKSVAELNG
jgi:hypothetical protein